MILIQVVQDFWKAKTYWICTTNVAESLEPVVIIPPTTLYMFKYIQYWYALIHTCVCCQQMYSGKTIQMALYCLGCDFEFTEVIYITEKSSDIKKCIDMYDWQFHRVSSTIVLFHFTLFRWIADHSHFKHALKLCLDKLYIKWYLLKHTSVITAKLFLLNLDGTPSHWIKNQILKY